MRSLAPDLQGLVLDHLVFLDVLSATTVDRKGRSALAHLHDVNGIRSGVLALPKMVAKLSRCETLVIVARSADVMASLAWVLTAVRNLRQVSIIFMANANMESWHRSCETLARSTDAQDLMRVESFLIRHNDRTKILSTHLEDEAFHELIFRLPLDCALNTAVSCLLPHDVVGKLLARGANPNRPRGSPSRRNAATMLSMLSVACISGQPDVVQLLLEHGARDLNPDHLSHDCFAFTLLPFARAIPTMPRSTWPNATQVLQMLYDAGLKTKLTDWSFLHFALKVVLGALAKRPNKSQDILPCIKLIAQREPELACAINKHHETPLQYLLRMAPDQENIQGLVLTMARLLAKCEREVRAREASGHV